MFRDLVLLLLHNLLIINPEKRNKKKAATQIVAIVLALFVGIGCFFGMHFLKKGYNLVQSSISSSQNVVPKRENHKSPAWKLEREQDLVNDFSNITL